MPNVSPICVRAVIGFTLGVMAALAMVSMRVNVAPDLSTASAPVTGGVRSGAPGSRLGVSASPKPQLPPSPSSSAKPIGISAQAELVRGDYIKWVDRISRPGFIRDLKHPMKDFFCRPVVERVVQLFEIPTGLVIEAGVWQAESLLPIAAALKDRTVYGFDSFRGTCADINYDFGFTFLYDSVTFPFRSRWLSPRTLFPQRNSVWLAAWNSNAPSGV